MKDKQLMKLIYLYKLMVSYDSLENFTFHISSFKSGIRAASRHSKKQHAASVNRPLWTKALLMGIHKYLVLCAITAANKVLFHILRC
jgi:hypothetical protein